MKNGKDLFLRLKKYLSRKIKANKKAYGIYYVNGTEMLPPPLSKEKELEMLGKIQTDAEARKLLIEHNLRLVVYIAKRFENTGIYIEDLVSIGTIGLVKAINTFNPTKNRNGLIISPRP